MGIKKSQRVPSFTVFGIVRFYKRNNFRVKISRFSQAQHAISDFCFFLIKKDQFFSMRLFFKICFTEAPPQFLPDTRSFARVKDSSRFSPLCDLPETIKNIFEKFFSSFFCFFFKERWFFAVFSWGRMVLETYAYPFGYFWRFKIDEILCPFTLGSSYDIAYLVSSKVRKCLRSTASPLCYSSTRPFFLMNVLVPFNFNFGI